MGPWLWTASLPGWPGPRGGPRCEASDFSGVAGKGPWVLCQGLCRCSWGCFRVSLGWVQVPGAFRGHPRTACFMFPFPFKVPSGGVRVSFPRAPRLGVGRGWVRRPVLGSVRADPGPPLGPQQFLSPGRCHCPSGRSQSCMNKPNRSRE